MGSEIYTRPWIAPLLELLGMEDDYDSYLDAVIAARKASAHDPLHYYAVEQRNDRWVIRMAPTHLFKGPE